MEIGCNNSLKGFTLIEILVVLIVISLATSLMVINFSSVASIQNQNTSLNQTFNYLSEESIVTGKIIGWVANKNIDNAYTLTNDYELKDPIEGHISHWKKLQGNRKTFKSFDGSINEIDDDYSEPLLIFYPSGENSGGILYIYFNDYTQELIVGKNGKIQSNILND